MYSYRTTRLLLTRSSIIPQISRRYLGAVASEAPRPKIHDTAGKFTGDAADVAEHNREFEARGYEGPIWRKHDSHDHDGPIWKSHEHEDAAPAAGNVGGIASAGPKIQNAAGKFEGNFEDVERHNQEFNQRKH